MTGLYNSMMAWILHRKRLERAAGIVSRFGITIGKKHYSEISISPEVRKLLGIALLSGTNIAIGANDRCLAISIVGSVARSAPQFSKIAVAARNVQADTVDRLFIKNCMEGKHDVAFVAEDILLEYDADIVVCPFSGINILRIMNFCRTRVNYIAVLNKSFDHLLKRRSIEGVNSIDMLIVPFGNGFAMHELRWLSRAETEDGIEVHGEDILEMRKIGTNLSLGCDPEETKVVRRYSRIRGESPHTVWSGYAAHA